MDDLQTKLLSLTDQELRQHLEESGGYDGTPVTPSTRMLLVRKLTRNLLKGTPVDDAVVDKPGVCSNVVVGGGNRLNEDGDKSNVPCELDTCKQELNPIYYGIHLPKKLSSCAMSGPEESYVFTDKKEVMKFMKDFPHARFKVFRTRDEAEGFARLGAKAYGSSKESWKDKESTPNDVVTTAVTGEKISSFKAPKPQELIQLRKIIEKGDVNKFLEIVWKNPRYMVSSGDTPTILQEGSRYNALHIASKAGLGSMVEAILETVSNPAFVNLLYDCANGPQERVPTSGIAPVLASSCELIPGTKDQAVIDCLIYLQDLYLNTPEKGLNETPLHFACKFGKVEAVKVLMSYPACDRMRLNKFGETAEDIICSRAGKGSDAEKDIRQILKDCFYVPVIRPGDSSLQASVGDPFSPEKMPSPMLELKIDPKSPAKEINAFAGPMSLERAQEFCLQLKSPLRGRCRDNESYGMQTPKSRVTTPGSLLRSGSFHRLRDPERGLERDGRALAKMMNVGWKEYWSFVGSFANLGTKEGLQILEGYLHRKLVAVLNSKKKSEDDSFGDGMRMDNIAAAGETNTDHITQQMSPISDLCLAMESCKLSSGKKSSEESKNTHPLPSSTCETTSAGESQPCHNPSPLHYVEKSCCIFARRITDLILREACGDKKRDFSRVIGFEVHHLRRLVSSFKDDHRFSSINFSCMHSRVASLAAEAILESSPSSSINKVLTALEVVQVKHLHLCSSSDEEDDRHLEKERNATFGVGGKEWRVSMRRGVSRVDCTDSVDEHTQCLMNLIKHAVKGNFLERDRVTEESNAVELLWAEAKSCSCSWPTSSPHYHSKLSSRSSAAVVRRLSFDKEAEYAENIEKSGNNNLRTAGNQTSLCDSSQQSDAKDFFQRRRNYSGDSDHSSREDAGSDTFYTPPSSPVCSGDENCSSDNEEMLDSEELPKVFIGGEYPTKEDLDVLNALEDAGNINPHQYPLIYQWRSLVLMHTQEERQSWPSPYSPRWKEQSRRLSIKSPDRAILC